MTVFVHDGSAPGFLCAAAELLNARLSGGGTAEFAVRGPAAPAGLFEERVAVPRDDGRARRLWERLRAKVGSEAAGTLLEAFLSDLPGADGAAAAMAVRLWREGTRALDDLAEPNAGLLEKASKRACGEAHRFLGLVRFAELSGGAWYARIDPDCDVLPLIAAHFAARFPLMRWIIHDGRRGKAILHECGPAWAPVEGFELSPGGLPYSEDEIRLRGAWRRYFDAVAIEGRANPRLQASFMPKKHWKNLPEMEGATSEP